MDQQQSTQLVNQLKDGEIKEFRVSKDDFLEFRKTLVQREDFKHFRGIAQRGGDVIYRYLETPRS
ncbi:hypothetical protein [Bacillus sp. CGMCC 1.16541]|uniref:hypothetical protein n=1 Tax=Bacillus sp. CGMCC 1.16541 TaxID=2185143 RepID=UPI000D72B32C|nr:hypothetical protein [Bacillus sp. CGMCC 1.16541]